MSGSSEVSITRAAVTVGLFAVATPLSFWTANAPRGASGWRLMVLAAGVLLAGLLVFWAISRFLARGRAVAISVVFTFAMLNWRLLGRPLRILADGLPLDLAPVPVLAALLAAAWMFGDRREFQLPALAMGAVMALSPLPGLVAWYAGGAIEGPEGGVSIAPWAGGGGDVYFIVLDGYGRPDLLEELYDYSMATTISSLGEQGFIIPGRSQATYSSTVASVASALLIEHVGTEGERPTDRERVGLHAVIGGRNPVAQAFQSSGYRYVHVESGWDGARCTDAVDECLSATFTDEVVGALLERTALAWWFESRAGHAFTVNGLRALSDIVDLEEADVGDPRFVFAHVVLPHPPLFVDQDCDIRFERDLGGGAIGSVDLNDDDLLTKRKSAYGVQVDCVNRRLLDFAALLEPDDIVIITGDHGPDSFGQLSLNPSEWSADAIRERMSVFSAVRLPGCHDSVTEDWRVIDALRLVVDCLNGDKLPVPDEGMFVYPLDSSPGVTTRLELKR